MSFVHLHCHSEYSTLDGINKLGPLCDRVKELGMDACALTDHGNLHGMVEFYKTAKAAGIKPLLGVETYITDDPDGMKEGRTRDNHHMILLAMNNEGLKNMIWLTNNANLNNFYYKPRIWTEHLKERAKGLIATSACIGGVVAQYGKWDDEKEIYHDPEGTALKQALKLQEWFEGRFYLEIQDNDMWEQESYNKWVIQASMNYELPLVITADAHYLREQDQAIHKMIMAQQLKKTLSEYEGDDSGKMKYGGGFYIRTPDNMIRASERMWAEDACENTVKIANMCNVELDLGKYQMPEFDISQEDDYEDFKKWKQTQDFECTRHK